MNKWPSMASVMFAGLALVAVPNTADAGIRHYQAEYEQSQWQLNTGTELQCVLQHNIPRYGKAEFVSNASKQLNLQFTLNMLRKPDAITEVKLQSVPPRWRPGRMAHTITDLQFYRQFDGELGKQDAWMMLHELERGMQPTFYYQDWQDQNAVAVSLSVVNFAPGYQDFVDCLANLLPYGYEDVAFTVLHHDKYGELTSESEQQLARVLTFLNLDGNAEVVLLDVHTDSYGTETTNDALTFQQAQKLKQHFIDNGIPEQRISAQGHGEDRLVDGNATEVQRQNNRRVIVRVERY